MQTSNNSPLLKDSQELTKTKGTIWKPLIAVSLLSVFSFTAGQYLPYIIAVVSGSGAIAAVPLAIFAVSVVVALVLATYLIKLAVSDNKKEAGPDGKESGHTASQEPQKFVCESCTNLENRSSVPTPTPPSVTLGTQPNPSVSVPPPPPPPPPHFFTASKRTEQPKNGAPKKAGEPENDNDRSALLKQIREGIKLKATNDDTTQENTPHPKKLIPPGGGERQNGDLVAELSKRLKSRRKGISGEQEDDEQQSNKLEGVHGKISAMIPLPRNSSVSSDSGNVSDDEDWETEPEPIEQVSSGSQSLHRERSESPGSAYESKSPSPSHSVPKVEKPLAPLKPAGLQMRSPVTKMNNVDPVNNEVPNSSTLSFKELRKKFENGSSLSSSQNKFTYRSDCIKIV